MTPRSSPPANAIGIERSPPSTTAASEPSTTKVMIVSWSWKIGAMRTPAKPASTIVIVHASADVRAALTPRRPASVSRSTTARISSPARVWRDDEPEHDRREGGDDEHRDLVAVERDVVHQPVLVRRSGPDSRDVHAAAEVLVRLQVMPAECVASHRDHQPLHEVGERDEQTDGPDYSRVYGRARESPEQDPVEQQPEQWSEDEHRDDQRRDDGDTETGVQLPVEIRGGERDRPVREVEDARRDVREHQARREDGEDRAGHQTRQRKADELVHRPPYPLSPR